MATTILVSVILFVLGGISMTMLFLASKKEPCRVPVRSRTKDPYNTCILNKPHKGYHMTADGHRFRQ